MQRRWRSIQYYLRVLGHSLVARCGHQTPQQAIEKEGIMHKEENMLQYTGEYDLNKKNNGDECRNSVSNIVFNRSWEP